MHLINSCWIIIRYRRIYLLVKLLSFNRQAKLQWEIGMFLLLVVVNKKNWFLTIPRETLVCTGRFTQMRLIVGCGRNAHFVQTRNYIKCNINNVGNVCPKEDSKETKATLFSLILLIQSNCVYESSHVSNEKFRFCPIEKNITVSKPKTWKTTSSQLLIRVLTI